MTPVRRRRHISAGTDKLPAGSNDAIGSVPAPDGTPSKSTSRPQTDAEGAPSTARLHLHQGAPPAVTDGGRPPTDDADPLGGGLFKRVVIGIVVFALLIVVARLLVPHVGFLDDAWQNVRRGDPVWLLVAVVLEVFAFAGYVLVFDGTARRAGLRLPRFTTWRIVLAGVAATRLLATAGAGGVASTTFALRRHGLDARHAAATVAAQIAIIYVWFVLLIALVGAGLFLAGHGRSAITIVPAGVAAGILLVAGLGRPLLHRLGDSTTRHEGRIARVLAAIPGTLDDGIHTVSTLVRERDIAIFGGALWWLADAAALWSACHAFGASPNMLDVTMAYLIGQVANLLPIPGGLGVEAGLLGMLIAFGVPAEVAIPATLTQRLISTWLPALPGSVALVAIGRPSPDSEVVAVDQAQPHARKP